MADVFLFDTNIATAIWDVGSTYHQQALDFAASLGKDSKIMISVVTPAEVEYGLRIAPKIDASRQESVRNAMRQYALVTSITTHTVEFYAEIRSKLFLDKSPIDARGRLKIRWPEDLVDRTTGKSMGVQENDIWIAAQAMEMDLVWATADKMDRIASLQLNPGLRIVYWR